MEGVLLFAGVLVARFVGFNIGGATTGPAFGPAVGSNAISKIGAAALIAVFFFFEAWTIGRRVVTKLGRGPAARARSVYHRNEHLPSKRASTIETSIVVLFFVGGSLFVGNYVGVPASTSMTAVGSIAGLGIATGELNWVVMGEVAVWWIVAPIVGFWVSMMIGRYLYPCINQVIAIDSTEGPLVELDRSGSLPRPTSGPNTTRRKLSGGIVVVAIGCLMAFSSGTSKIANAIAPLVGAA